MDTVNAICIAIAVVALILLPCLFLQLMYHLLTRGAFEKPRQMPTFYAAGVDFKCENCNEIATTKQPNSTATCQTCGRVHHPVCRTEDLGVTWKRPESHRI